jgi:hypothetical protein
MRKVASQITDSGFRHALFLIAALFAFPFCALAQDSPQAPMAPPPDHQVVRMGTEPEAGAPPALPPDEIIKRLAQNEDQYFAVHPTYGYRRTIRIDEFGPDGKVAGQYLLVTETTRDTSGRVFNKVVQHPQSTLHFFTLEPEDVKEVDRVPPFPLTTGQLAKYNLKYIGTELIDEIDCYIFQVKPKGVDRAHAYFDGLVWVDTQKLGIVRTYGKWVNELGDVHSATMPFTMYETYRENVDGKYWFPNYERSDSSLTMKDSSVPLRLTIKWSDFKLLAAAPVATPPANPASDPPSPAAPAKP